MERRESGGRKVQSGGHLEELELKVLNFNLSR